MNLEDVILRGTRAAQPAANTVPAGSLYYVTDETVTERSTGAAWQTYADGGGSGITTLTGNVTAGPGSGSQVATIAADAVTYAKMQNVSAASKLLGRGDSGSGDPQEITLGTGLAMTGTTLSSSGGSAAWTLITSSTPSGVNVVNFTGLAAYTDIRVLLKQMTFAVADELRLRVSTDNGSTYLSAGGDYVGIQGSGAESSAAEIRFYVGNATAARSGEIHINGFSLTSPKVARSNFFSTDGVNLWYMPSASAFSAVRVLSNGTNNISGGTIYVYGR